VTGSAFSSGCEFSSSVCESTDWPEKLFVRVDCSCCEEEDSSGGEALRCDAGRWGGSDAMLVIRRMQLAWESGVWVSRTSITAERESADDNLVEGGQSNVVVVCSPRLGGCQ
jgi:hypothetical protein